MVARERWFEAELLIDRGHGYDRWISFPINQKDRNLYANPAFPQSCKRNDHLGRVLGLRFEGVFVLNLNVIRRHVLQIREFLLS